MELADINHSEKDNEFYNLLFSNAYDVDEPYKLTQDLSYELFVLNDSSFNKKDKYDIYDKLYKDALIKKAVDNPI